MIVLIQHILLAHTAKRRLQDKLDFSCPKISNIKQLWWQIFQKLTQRDPLGSRYAVDCHVDIFNVTPHIVDFKSFGLQDPRRSLFTTKRRKEKKNGCKNQRIVHNSFGANGGVRQGCLLNLVYCAVLPQHMKE